MSEENPTTQDVYRVLRSIDATLATMAEHMGALRLKDTHQADAAATVPAVASDADLDGKYGNPEIKMKDPRDWTGDTMRGRLYSECPPEYLDLFAERFDYFIGLAEEELAQSTGADVEEVANLKKKIKYNRKDAARARGWAKRLRAGWQPPPEEPSGFGTETPVSSAPLTDDDIPF